MINQSDTSKGERSLRAQTDLEQSHEPLRSYELRTSEDRYRDLAEQAIDGLLVTDSSGRPLDANRAACDLMGYSLEELRTLGPEDIVTADEGPRLPGLFERLRDGHIVRDEWRLRRKDGSIFVGEVAGRQLPDGRLQAVVRDVSERKEAEEAQRKLHQLAVLSLDKVNLEQVLGAIVEAAIAITHADFGTIQLLDEESSHLRIVAQRGFPQWWVEYWQTILKGHGPYGAPLLAPIVVEDVDRCPLFTGSDLEMQHRVGVRAVQSTPLVSRSGRPIGMFSTHHRMPNRPDERTRALLDLLAREAADIIGQVQAESELKTQAALLDLAHNSVFVRDFDGRITYWNQGATQYYGWSKDEAVGMISYRLLQTQFPEAQQRILDIMKGTGGWEGELVHTCRDGRRITVDSRWAILRDAERDRILEISNDITPRKQAEAALRESEQQLQAYIDQAGDGIYVLDGESGRILKANARAEQMLGYSREELLQLSASDIECSHTPANINDIHEGSKRRIADVEGTHQRKDGSRFPVEIRLTSLAPETPHRVLAIVRDVSERKRLEQERAQEARRKDEFLAFLGHELRNPLAAIHTAVQVLSGSTTPAQRASMEATIARQTALMRRLVDDLLEMERITHGHIELKREPLNLADCLQHAGAAVQSTVASRKQELLLRLPPESVRFMADGARLEQIVGNLLTNASKYTQPGGRVELSGEREGADVVIRCKDNGQGILPEYQQTIFEPFARGQKTELGYGEASVGLGLALVRQLTELHGGTISVDSGGAGVGSEFTVRVPLVAPPSIQPAHAARSERTSRRARTVAIVEDNPSVATTLKAALEQAGYSVHLFADGPSTLAGVPHLKPDALLIEIGLPGMSGYELASRLQQREDTRHIPRIAVSGLRPREHTWAGAEFDHYFRKPVDVPALLALLDEY